MLEFIENNVVLCTIVSSALFGIIGFIVKAVIEKKRRKKDTIASLRKELAEADKRLKEYSSIEEQEKHIEKKASSAIYAETMPNGNKRSICAYCWEQKHIKTPIVVDLCYDDYAKQNYYEGYCQVCKSRCIENINPEQRIRTIGDTSTPTGII